MYDYKFRQNDLPFSKPSKPKKPPRRKYRMLLLGGAGIILAAGVLYGILHLVPPRQGDSEILETGSENIIPLPLPPYTEPQEPAVGSDG